MLVNLVQYSGTVGVFNNCKLHNRMVANKCYSSQCGCNAELAVLAPFSIHQIVLLLLAIVMWMLKDNHVQSAKMHLHFICFQRCFETNPGPKRNSTETFSFCHWNVNSISSHNNVKMFLLKAYITDTLTYRPDDENLKIAGYDIARADHPTNTK